MYNGSQVYAFRVEFKTKSHRQSRTKKKSIGAPGFFVSFQGNFEQVRSEIFEYVYPHIKGTLSVEGKKISVTEVTKGDYATYRGFVFLAEPKSPIDFSSKKIRSVSDEGRKKNAGGLCCLIWD